MYNEIIPFEQYSLDISNGYLLAKQGASLLENQVMRIAQSRIQMKQKGKDVKLQATLYPSELKRLISDEDHIYRDLKKLSKSIIGHTAFFEDGNGNFKAFAVVTNATYEDGAFTLDFNDEIRDHLIQLKENRIPHTSLAISIMVSFSRNSSFRIYEVLKKDLFRIGKKGNEDSVTVEYSLYEFRFMIGIANADNKDVKKYTDSVSVIDWEKAYNILLERGGKSDCKYKDVDKLQKDCIKVAQKELEEKSDLRFEYKLIPVVGKKFGRIQFTIYNNTPKETGIILEKQQYANQLLKKNRQLEYPMDVFRDMYDEYVGYNDLSKKDIDFLLLQAAGDPEKLKEAIKYADEYSKKTPIENYVGFLHDCITKEWTTTPVSDGSAEKGKRVKKVQEYYEQGDRNEIGKQAWEKIKKISRFQKFLDALYLQGITDAEQFEIINDYDYQEMVKIYTDFQKTKKIEL